MPAPKSTSGSTPVRKTLTPGVKPPPARKRAAARKTTPKRTSAKSGAKAKRVGKATAGKSAPSRRKPPSVGKSGGSSPKPFVSRGPHHKTSIPTVTVGDFYTFHQNILHLRLLAGAAGLKRKISEGAVNRPGLALSGFYKSFAAQRVQVIGSGETAYLNSLPEKTSRQRLRELFTFNIPCIIFARNIKPPKVVLEEAEESGIAVFKSPMTTMRLLNTTTICLELDFAPTMTEYGSMIDIQGIGVMIRGQSGIGKSEVVLSLIERGHSLVSDDITKIRSLEGRELIGTSADLSRFHMEVRGLGIINVASIFGVRSIRYEKRLDLVVTLRDWHDVGEVDRIGLEEEFYEVLQIKVPHITIPVRQGRNLASLVEVAALDQKLKSMGQNSAAEFNERLLQVIRTKES